jgi:hypothetical protein
VRHSFSGHFLIGPSIRRADWWVRISTPASLRRVIADREQPFIGGRKWWTRNLRRWRMKSWMLMDEM